MSLFEFDHTIRTDFVDQRAERLRASMQPGAHRFRRTLVRLLVAAAARLEPEATITVVASEPACV